jgi:hypothetical protein
MGSEHPGVVGHLPTRAGGRNLALRQPRRRKIQQNRPMLLVVWVRRRRHACNIHVSPAARQRSSRRVVCFHAAQFIATSAYLASSRSGLSASARRERSAHYPPPRRGGEIIIRDAPRGSSSAPIKRDATVKIEEAPIPRAPQDVPPTGFPATAAAEKRYGGTGVGDAGGEPSHRRPT